METHVPFYLEKILLFSVQLFSPREKLRKREETSSMFVLIGWALAYLFGAPLGIDEMKDC